MKLRARSFGIYRNKNIFRIGIKFFVCERTIIPDIPVILMCLLPVTRKSQLFFFFCRSAKKTKPQVQRSNETFQSAFPELLPVAGRGLEFGFSALILAVISSQTLFFLQFTFLKSSSCSLYWEINSEVSSAQKPVLLSTASTLSPEHDAIFVSSGNNVVIIPAIPAILLLGAE